MGAGRSIRIYLADSTVSGIRHGEIVNWTGQAIACPRARFSELREWPEIRRPGIYFLFGTDEETGRDALYIGEAEVVIDRLSSHVSGKDFWNELITFTSKDDNLTKAHVRYLEARSVQIAADADRYFLTNSAIPQTPALPRADRDAMEEYLNNVRILLGVLGHRALEALAVRPTSRLPLYSLALDQQKASTQNVEPSEQATFHLKVGKTSASAIQTDEGVVVLAGSEVAPQVQSSLSGGYKALRERLRTTNVIEEVDGVLRFSRDHLFSSPSQAAAVIVGYAINGRDTWRTKDGQTLGSVELSTANRVLHELMAPKSL